MGPFILVLYGLVNNFALAYKFMITKFEYNSKSTITVATVSIVYRPLIIYNFGVIAVYWMNETQKSSPSFLKQAASSALLTVLEIWNQTDFNLSFIFLSTKTKSGKWYDGFNSWMLKSCWVFPFIIILKYQYEIRNLFCNQFL